MAGHSKWANIKHKKGREDAKRAKIFTKLIRDITVAARNGDDLSMNPGLRLAVEKANVQNMPKDTIKRAIAKGSGAGADGANYETIKYEGYGPCAVAIWVHCLTDNKNRTVAEVRHAFSKHGGNLGTDGSVNFMFKNFGIIITDKMFNEDKLLEIALDAGAIDVINNLDNFEVRTEPSDYEQVKNALVDKEISVISSEVTWICDDYIKLEASEAESVLKLVDVLEDLDDVQEVYTNADFSCLEDI